MYALELTGITDISDALLMKNPVFLFGHIIVNVTMYLGVGIVYELLPAYAGRPWKNNRWVAIAWNTVLLLIIAAYFHHLYMDFAQIRVLHLIGQVMSYALAIPAAAVSIYGTLALVWRSRVKWSMASLLMYCGVVGWTVGGIGALIDSTIAINVKFHNTLWVPGDFHTYFLVGVVLLTLGAVFHLCGRSSGLPESPRRSRLCTGLICAGGYGFVLMFYLGGAMSIPRRYAQYHDLISTGQWPLDKQQQQFNHPAITVAPRAGKFARISVGDEISPGRFKEMLSDARGEFVLIYPAPGQRGALFRYFDYDPERGFTPNWGMLILILAGVVELTLAAGLFMTARFANAPGRKT